jgi:hypothetical protein
MAILESYLHLADFHWGNSVTNEITGPCSRSYMTVLRQIDGTKVVYQQRIWEVLGSNSDEDQMYFVLHILQPNAGILS